MIEIFEKAALAAGRVILEIYQSAPTVIAKPDRSPVTEADIQAEAVILSILVEELPDLPVVAEESVSAGQVPASDGRSFILVDPLDGTKEFIDRRAEFTVNIALIEAGAPVAGIVYAPAMGVAYTGSSRGAEKLTVSADFSITHRFPIHVRKHPHPLVAVASRSHNNPQTEQFLRDNGVGEYEAIGSSLKFCLLAEGKADVYPRFGRTMEWDTAAADAVLRAAGGQTLCLDNQPLTYGKRQGSTDSDFANPHFVAWGANRSVPATGLSTPFEAHRLDTRSLQ